MGTGRASEHRKASTHFALRGDTNSSAGQEAKCRRGRLRNREIAMACGTPPQLCNAAHSHMWNTGPTHRKGPQCPLAEIQDHQIPDPFSPSAQPKSAAQTFPALWAPTVQQLCITQRCNASKLLWAPLRCSGKELLSATGIVSKKGTHAIRKSPGRGEAGVCYLLPRTPPGDLCSLNVTLSTSAVVWGR